MSILKRINFTTVLDEFDSWSILARPTPTTPARQRLVHLAAARRPWVREDPITGRIRVREGGRRRGDEGGTSGADGGRREGNSGRRGERQSSPVLRF
jgi:hypothetical protein